MIALGLFSMTLGAQTQQNQPPKYWLVQHVLVKDHSNNQYESCIEELIESINQETHNCPPLNWFAFVSEKEGIYTYVIPVPAFQNLTQIYQSMAQELSMFSNIHQEISDEVKMFDMLLMQEVPQLSYHASQTPSENFVNIVESIEVNPGREAEFESMVLNWIQSGYGSRSASWTLFTTLIGSNLPRYTLVYNGPSEADFNSQISQLVGEDWKYLIKKNGSGILRSHQMLINTYARNLSSLSESSSN